MNFPSKNLELAVNEFAQLPGIGKRSALRIVLHLLKQSPSKLDSFSETLVNLTHKIKYCKICHTISDHEICDICQNTNRNKKIICVVEDVRDVMALENTNQFKGVYHVLGGKISPMEGIGPSQLTINLLIERVKQESEIELIFALNSSIESDTTIFYISKQLGSLELKLTTLARGIAVGDELEYTDEVTLGNSILNRIPLPLMLK